MSKEHWITHDQLDIPLCDIFSETKTNGTARQWLRWAELILRLPPANLESMSYVEMNKYMDYLDREIQRIV